MPKVKLDDIEMQYAEQGSGERIFIFIPGGGGSSESLKRTVFWQLLPADYHVYSLDTSKHGSLIDARNYTYSQRANDIYRASQKLKLGKFICVGYSMGGWIAFHMALEHPEALKALIIVGGAPPLRKEKQWWKSNRRESERLFTDFQDDPKALRAALEARLAPFFVRPQSNPAFKEFVNSQMSSTKEQRSDPVPGLPLPQAKTDKELMDLLGTIKVPTLMINGCKDRADKALRIASAIPGAKIVLFQDESHMIVSEGPEKIAEEIAHFVSQLEKTGSEQ
jgi:pimeloyl-ACP methyl ester carboxylesterase